MMREKVLFIKSLFSSIMGWYNGFPLLSCINTTIPAASYCQQYSKLQPPNIENTTKNIFVF